MAHTPAHHTDDTVSDAMDYAQHNATYKGVMAFTKWSIISLAFVVVALYCFIEGNQPVLGTVLLLAIPVLIGFVVVTRRRSA